MALGRSYQPGPRQTCEGAFRTSRRRPRWMLELTADRGPANRFPQTASADHLPRPCAGGRQTPPTCFIAMSPTMGSLNHSPW